MRSIRKVFTIASHEFRVMARRQSYRILTLLFPLLALVAVLAYSAIQGRGIGEKKPVVYGYVDLAGFAREYQEQGNVTFQSFPTLEEAQEILLKGDIQRLYMIPKDYPATGLVVEYASSAGISIARTANLALEEFLTANMLGKGAPDWVHERVRSPALVTRVQLDAAGHATPGIDPVNAFFFLALGILLIVSIFMTSGFLLNGIGEEKENRIMEILLSSVTAGQLMIGKIIGLGSAGLLQIVIWVVAGRFILDLAASRIAPLAGIVLPGASAFLGILYFLLGFLLFATLLAGLGAVTTTAREGQQVSGLFVVPAIIPYYAFPYIMEHPEGFIARFLTLFPLTAPITAMERLGTSSIRPWEIAASTLILAASCAAAMWFVVRLFRAYLLMYGKRPGLGEMWRALRQG